MADDKKKTNIDRIKELEEELSKTKYNKRTQGHIGLVKAKIAMLKTKEEGRRAKKQKGEGYSVKKSGDATVVLLGFPSVGKSTLLNTLTDAKSPVGAYAFTTLTVIPGLLKYKHAQIQVLDVPGIVHGASDGTGRGKEVLQVVRTADLIVVLLDFFHPEHYEAILREIYNSHVRINQTKPNVKITRTTKGGIDIGATVKLTHMDNETIERVLKEMKYVNASIVLREDITVDQLIDVIEANKEYIPAMTIVNKVDLASDAEKKSMVKKLHPDLMISAHEKLSIDELKELIFSKLQFIRLYLKEKGKKADMEEPMIMRKGDTIRTLCQKLHKDFLTKFRYAKIWGKSVKYSGQQIRRLDHVFCDEDIIELCMR